MGHVGRFWVVLLGVLGCLSLGGADAPEDQQRQVDRVVPFISDLQTLPNMDIRWREPSGDEQWFPGVNVQYFFRGTEVVLFPVWVVSGGVEMAGKDNRWESVQKDTPVRSAPEASSVRLRLTLRHLGAYRPASAAVESLVREEVAKKQALDPGTLRIRQPEIRFPLWVAAVVSVPQKNEPFELGRSPLTQAHYDKPFGEKVTLELQSNLVHEAGQLLGRPVRFEDVHLRVSTWVYSQLETRMAVVWVENLRGSMAKLREQIETHAGGPVEYLLPYPGGQGLGESTFQEVLLNALAMEVAIRQGVAVDQTLLHAIAQKLLDQTLQQVTRDALQEHKRILLMLDQGIGLVGTVGEITKLAQMRHSERQEHLARLTEEFLQKRKSSQFGLKTGVQAEGIRVGLVEIPQLEVNLGLQWDKTAEQNQLQRDLTQRAQNALDHVQIFLEGRMKTLSALRLAQENIESAVRAVQAQFTQAQFTTGYHLFRSPLFALLPAPPEEDLGKSLQEAVRTAFPGKKIVLKPGVYRLAEPLKITTSLSIVGAGADQTFLQAECAATLLQVHADGQFTLQDLTVERVVKKPGGLLEARAGVVSIQNCRFRGAIDAPALLLAGTVRGRIAHCQVTNNQGAGICCTDQAAPTLEENTCENNAKYGIYYGGNAGGTARKNICRGNTLSGIAAFDKAALTLEENTCENNAKYGIYYGGNAGGTARKNICRGNTLSGIAARDQAAPTLEENTCENNGQHGIYYGGNAGGTARNNICRGNGDSGIRIFGTVRRVWIFDNLCEQNQYGIQIGASAWYRKDNIRVLHSGQEDADSRNTCLNNRSANWSWNSIVD